MPRILSKNRTQALWCFPDEGEAYDACQTRHEIHDGDVLVTPTSVGLAGTWPVRVRGTGEAFHTLAPDVTWRGIASGDDPLFPGVPGVHLELMVINALAVEPEVELAQGRARMIDGHFTEAQRREIIARELELHA